MDSVMNETKVHPCQQGVSIIGVGCTPFMVYGGQSGNERTYGRKCSAYAALPGNGGWRKSAENFFHGRSEPSERSNYLTPNIQVAKLVRHERKGFDSSFGSLLHLLLCG